MSNLSSSDLLEQYRIYVTLTDKLAERRQNNHGLYVVLSCLLLALIQSIFIFSSMFRNIGFGYFMLSVIGMVLCISWIINIIYNKRLINRKYKVIFEMEQQLPFQPYTREDRINYTGLSYLELVTPVLFFILFAFHIFVAFGRG